MFIAATRVDVAGFHSCFNRNVILKQSTDNSVNLSSYRLVIDQCNSLSCFDSISDCKNWMEDSITGSTQQTLDSIPADLSGDTSIFGSTPLIDTTS